jgi:serine/threonine protein kinase
VDAALELYAQAKDHPQSTTITAFRTQRSINVGQPLNTHSQARLFRANSATTGVSFVIKSPRHVVDEGEPVEIQTCKALADILEKPSLAFVPTTVDIIEIRSAEEAEAFGRRGSFYALIMPLCEGTLADPLQNFDIEFVHTNLLRIIAAVECLHLRRYVHMDIKGDNIFLLQGKWLLSDFGSCVEVGQAVTSYTDWFYPDRLRLGQTPARFLFDWYMLAVAILAQLAQDQWKDQLYDQDSGRVSRERVDSAAANIEFAPVRNLITRMLVCDTASLPSSSVSSSKSPFSSSPAPLPRDAEPQPAKEEKGD